MADTVFGDVVMSNDRFESLNARVNVVAEDVATTKANVAILLQRTEPVKWQALLASVVSVITVLALTANFALAPIRADAADALNAGVVIERRIISLETKHNMNGED